MRAIEIYLNPLIYINFTFDFLDLPVNVFFENCFANYINLLTFAVHVLSDLKILGFASYLYYLIKHRAARVLNSTHQTAWYFDSS
jgi:hypothetical protein